MSIDRTLRQAEIFFGLTNQQLDLIISICSVKHYNTGDVIFEENSASDELYVIESGEVDIQIDPALVGESHDLGPTTIATLRRGQSFGEVALVDRGLRSASARCAQHDTQLLVIPRDKLMLLCDAHPRLGYCLMRNLAADLATKMRSTDLRSREHQTWAHSK